MDADTVLRIRPASTDYLKEFDDCFVRVTTRRHLNTYVEGQLSDLRRKSVEPIADAAGTPTRWSIARSTRIALGQVRRALSNWIRFAWLTFDEGYGGKPPLLRGLDALDQNCVAELPTTFRVWTQRPAVRYRAHGRERRMLLEETRRGHQPPPFF